MPEFAQHMKPFVVLGRFASLASLFAVVGSAQALQISTPNSVVWLGRPFEIDVSLLADAPNEVAADCISVELFDGTNRIGPSRIRVAASDLGDGRKWRLSIRSSQAIEEPFVRLIVRLNCRQNLTREFVLLSEPFIERPSASIQRLAAPAEKAGGVGVAPVPDRASLPQRTVPSDSSPVVPTQQKNRSHRGPEREAAARFARQAQRSARLRRLGPLRVRTSRGSSCKCWNFQPPMGSRACVPPAIS